MDDPIDVYGMEGIDDRSEKVSQLALFSVRDEPEDVWRSMPDYEQRALTPYRSVTVQFRTEHDYVAFKKLIGADKLREAGGLNTHNFWYPPIEPKKWSEKEWVSEVTDPPSIAPEAEDIDPEGVVIDAEERAYLEAGLPLVYEPVEGVLDLRPSDSLGPFLDRVARHKPTIDKEALATLARAQIRDEAINPLEPRWYKSLEERNPDYGIYADDLYIAEAWHCWASYSRKYLRFVRANREELFSDVSRIVDLGCGFGYTSRALKEIFPEAEVIGTQIEGTLQYRVAEMLGQEYGFRVATELEEVGAADLVFASEYFEHIEAPIDHLLNVIDAIEPSRLLIANAFGARAAGHFDNYRANPIASMFVIDHKTTAKLFRKTLRARGYGAIDTPAWNNRPRLWVKSEGY